jgi:hypothetical protein
MKFTMTFEIPDRTRREPNHIASDMLELVASDMNTRVSNAEGHTKMTFSDGLVVVAHWRYEDG